MAPVALESIQTFLKERPQVSKIILAGAAVGLVALRQWRSFKELRETPPGELGWLDTIFYAIDPVEWTIKKMRRHGPIFKCWLFFRPTICFGGPQALKQFLAIERRASKSSLPDAFQALHGPYSALNQAGEDLAASRKVFSAVLGTEAMHHYESRAAALASSFVRQSGSGERALMPWVSDFAFALFTKLFIGCDRLKPGMRECFEQYNEGLLSILPLDLPWTTFGKATRAKAALLEDINALIQERGDVEGFDFFATATDAYKRAGRSPPADWAPMVILLFVWGAVTETRVQIADMIYLLVKHPESLRQATEAARGTGARKNDVIDRIVLEAVRLMPPTGGGMRMLDEEKRISLDGHEFRLPKGWVLTADPRMSHADAKLFPEPERFEPDRWKDEKLSQSPGFHPGGVGAHKCPGMPLAFLVAKLFVQTVLEIYDLQAVTPVDSAKFTTLPFHAITDDFIVSLKPLRVLGA